MKPTTGNAPPRRLAKPKKQVRLDLRRRATKPEPAGDIEIEQKNTFWKFVGIVALLHVVGLAAVGWYYAMTPTPPPPVQMISLLPLGDVVKGTPGEQSAPKLGPTTPAPTVQKHHSETPPPAPTPTPVVNKPTPVVKKPAPVVKPIPKPVVKSDAPALIPPKPTPAPVKPKVKVDLTLADGPTPPPVKHPVKPKVHKKATPAVATDDNDSPDNDSPSNPDSQGLSKEQIAQKLGQKLQSAGATNATNHGASGSKNSQANQFQDFYLSVRDQVMSKWTSPNLTDETALTPEVTIHVEKDGRVPPDQVTLTRSSGNQAYDDSAVAAAKSLGYLLQPLPDGCPPDIHINFKLTR